MVLGARYASTRSHDAAAKLIRLSYEVVETSRSTSIRIFATRQDTKERVHATDIKALDPELHPLDKTIVKELRSGTTFGEVPDKSLARLLPLLVQRRAQKNGEALRIGDESLIPRIRVENPEIGGLRVVRCFSDADGDWLDSSTGRLLCGPQAYFLKGRIAWPIETEAPWDLEPWGRSPETEFRHGLSPLTRDDLVRELRKVGVPDEDLEGLEVKREPPDHITVALGVPNAENKSPHVHAALSARYGPHRAPITNQQPGSLYLGDVGDEAGLAQRDIESETMARRHMQQIGFRYERAHGCFVAKGEAALSVLDPTRVSFPSEWQVTYSDNVPRFLSDIELTARAELLDEKGLVDVNVAFHSGSGNDTEAIAALIDMKEMLAWLSNDKQYLRLKDGSFVAPSERFRANLAVVEDLGAASGRALVSPLCVGLLSKLSGQGALEAANDATKAWLDEVSGLTQPAELEPPATVQAVLRDYQRRGLDWLGMLHRYRLTGILADDMGLGKTLQTLTLLLWAKEREGNKPSLVVAPTSVVSVWRDEAIKFMPTLRTTLWYGPPKVRQEINVDDFDLVITSYGILRRDADVLAEKKFRYILLDEAQSTKNAASQNARAIRKLVSERRLALTGTPIENRAEELWAIFDFLAPGFLGSARNFKNRYARPISKGDNQALDLLRTRTKPLVLRRLKEEVATELPPKSEAVVRCQMGPGQRALYDHIAGQLRDNVMAKIAEVGIERAQLDVLAALMRLRQICCDPALLPHPTGAKIPESAKLALFEELVSEAIGSGRTIVVFSQFVEMQKRILALLKEMHIDSLWLHGGTRNRDKVVASFQDPEGPPIIVVSLRAGGMGLTLTRADTVMHYDPWWNPAVERQATDRAYRIGQDKAVQVYKLIAADTIEERVQALAAEKAELAESLLGSEGGPGAKRITQDDVMALLR